MVLCGWCQLGAFGWGATFAADGPVRVDPLAQDLPKSSRPFIGSAPAIGPHALQPPSLLPANHLPLPKSSATVTIGDQPSEAIPPRLPQRAAQPEPGRIAPLLSQSLNAAVQQAQDRAVQPAANFEAVSITLAAAENLAKTRAAELAKLNRPAADPAALDGIQPGKSSWAETQTKFGEPRQSTIKNGNGVATYDFPPFQQLELTLRDNQVEAMRIETASPLTPEAVAKQLGLNELHSVIVTDERGAPLGIVFPERGVLFSLNPAATGVTAILLEPLDAESYLTRAEELLAVEPRWALADLEEILSAQPNNAAALGLQAKLLGSLGHWTDALRAAQAAIAAEPNNLRWPLVQADLLRQSDQVPAARELLATILAKPNLTPILKAQAECLLGDALACGPRRDYAQAIEHHLAALKLAEPLIGSSNLKLRRDAKRVLLDANLAVANDIAWGEWQQKQTAVPRWLERGLAVARDLIAKEEADDEALFAVYRQALAACAGTQGQLDPTDYAKQALATSKKLITVADDPWRRQRLEWELGQALYDALQADQARGLQGHALANSALVVKYLENGAAFREQTALDAFLLGRLYYRVGAIFALEKQDHRTAAHWYDKAAPLLANPLPEATPGDWGRHGETLVSIGLSYWETERSAEAIKLTERGIEWMVRAVKANGQGTESLAVPYGNLAQMHRALGNNEQSLSYQELAGRVNEKRRR